MQTLTNLIKSMQINADPSKSIEKQEGCVVSMDQEKQEQCCEMLDMVLGKTKTFHQK